MEKTKDGYTDHELADSVEIDGYETKEYTTSRKDIEFYREAKDLDNNIKPSNAEGTMMADTIVVKYYYERIPAGVTVKYLEKITYPDGRVEGAEIEGVDDEFIKGYLGLQYKTSRKQIENYVPAEPPKIDEGSSRNIIYVDKDSDKLDGTYSDSPVEIVYWYERQFHISTKVKPHAHTNVESGEQEMVKGGSISGDITAEETLNTPYEDVLRSRANKKSVELIPDDGYRVKDVIINGKVVDLSEFEKDDKSIVIPEGYFDNVQEDILVEVEFEKIPSSLTVKYVDSDTGEDIIPPEQTDGFVNDEYTTERKELESYIPAGQNPENSKGKLVEDGVTVTYYYIRQFKITTDVLEHYEFEVRGIVDVAVDEDNNITLSETTENDELAPKEPDSNMIEGGKILIKGGIISGEDERPYELVNRGKSNEKEIQIIPDDGYRIKLIQIRQPGAEIERLDLENLQEEGNKYIQINNKENNCEITLKAGYFTNMQSDKHIEVEFERIPAKVTVEYLDKDTGEKVSKSEVADGYVDDEFRTHKKEIPYYELIEDLYPQNAEGKLDVETHVTYWYKKLLFNMKLTKELSSVSVNGNELAVTDAKLVKVDIANSELQSANILAKYKITVTNTEKVAGIAKVLEQIPEGFKPSSQMNVTKLENTTTEQADTSQQESTTATEQFDTWQQTEEGLVLTTRELQPEETAEYEVILEWDASLGIIGTLDNVAKITQTQNVPEFVETTLDDNEDSCTVLLTVKTGESKAALVVLCFSIVGIGAMVCVRATVDYRKRKNK